MVVRGKGFMGSLPSRILMTFTASTTRNTNYYVKAPRTCLKAPTVLIWIWVALVFLGHTTTLTEAATSDSSSAHKATSGILQYTMREENKPGHVLGNVAGDAGIDMGSGKLRFELIDNRDSGLFTLDTVTSSLSVTSVYDRDSEQHCAGHVTCTLRLSVAVVSPVDQFRVLSVRVRVVDIDDSPPSFSTGRQQEEGGGAGGGECHGPITIVRRVAESATVGRRIPLATPSDLDSPVNSRHTCTSASFPHLFRLEWDQPPVGDDSGRLAVLDLVLLTTLDRETVAGYTVKVVCQDGAGNRGELVVKVEVLDVNDHTPIFQQLSYDVEIGEDFEINKTVTSVLAEDKDLGLYGAVVYSLTPPTSRAQPFSVHPQSGDVRLTRRSLDFEERHQYRLTLTASDRSTSDPKTSGVPLLITVLDRNDNAPRLTVKTFNSGGGGGGGGDGWAAVVVAAVAENRAAGHFLAHVTCWDADSGDNGKTLCHVTDDLDSSSPASFRLEKLDDEQYKLTTARSLDRESSFITRGTNSQGHVYITATIKCTDQGHPSRLTSEVEVKVRVTDENDNAPVFKRGAYTFRVDEDLGVSGRERSVSRLEGGVVNTPSRFVGRVVASDADAGVYGMVRYSFSSPQPLFRINTTDGTISTRGSGKRGGVNGGEGEVLDYEQRRVFALTAVASDGGGAETRVRVNVQLTDLNDNPPRFDWSSGSDVTEEAEGGHAHLNLRLAENLSGGVLLTTFNVTDADRDPNHRRYRFTLVDTPTSDLATPTAVSVHPTTGQLRSTQQFDRETKSQYQFEVRAYDPFKKDDLHDTIRCTLIIEDRNDNAPELSTPLDVPGSGEGHDSVTSVVVRVSSHLPLGGVVYKVRASDADVDDVLTYALEASPSLSPAHLAFVVDKKSGVVTSARRFHDEVVLGVQEYRYEVKVVDQLGPEGHEVMGHFTVLVDASLPYPPTTTHATRDSRDARNRHLAVVVGIVVATAMVVAILLAAILVLRRRETRDRKRPVADTGNSAWQLPLSIEKITDISRHQADLYDSMTLDRSHLQNNGEYMQRSIQQGDLGELRTSGDLHLSAETVSGTSVDSGRGLSETQPDVTDDKGKFKTSNAMNPTAVMLSQQLPSFTSLYLQHSQSTDPSKPTKSLRETELAPPPTSPSHVYRNKSASVAKPRRSSDATSNRDLQDLTESSRRGCEVNKSDTRGPVSQRQKPILLRRDVLV